MKDIVRDSTIGQLLNWASKGSILSYRDQRKDYVVPDRYLVRAATNNRPATSTPTLVNADGALGSDSPTTGDPEKGENENDPKPYDLGLEIAAALNPFLIDWDGPDDPDNPMNWSDRKRLFVAFLIGFYTFSIYIGSAIFTSAIPSLIADFHTTQVVATLGLSLFVLAYGIGPMFLAPIQDIPRFGRNPVYIAGLFLFVLFQMPPLLAKNMETILIFRFFAGFVGSPALATGGASMGDFFPPHQLPYAIAAWAIGAVCGPVLGPVIGGFAAQANGWRWPFFELLWISGTALIVLSLFLPETLGSTILIRRAERLRKLTGNPLLRTQAEIDENEGETVLDIAWSNFVRALKLNLEPAVLFSSLYIGLMYSVFYLWFEAFPLVFNDIYHFNLGTAGLPFLGFVVSGLISFFGYALYVRYHLAPRYARNPDMQPETRFELAIVAGFAVPVSLFLFGWSARPSVHWIVPVIGASIYLPGIYLSFQSILMYLAIGWPAHNMALFAGNDLARSSMASAFPLFGRFFFGRLGLGGGCSFLAGISLLMLPFLYLLMKHGRELRARSKWTD